MYKKIEPTLRMTANDAYERFPDSYIIMRMDSMKLSNDMGTVLYVGDNRGEMFSLVMKLDDPNLCGVMEGLNLQRSLGGIVVGE